jgi:predicted methyltransferase
MAYFRQIRTPMRRNPMFPATRWAYVLLFACACHRSGGPPQHYEDPKAAIAEFERDDRDSWQMPDKVVAALPIPSQEAVIAEIGAGSGYFTRRLALAVPQGKVYAVDVDTEFESYLLERREQWGTPNIEPHLAHYDDPVLPPQAIDLVFSANTYAFIRTRIDYFRKIHNVLRPGGTLAIIDFRPDATPPGNIAPEPEHRIGRDQALQELQQAGFALVKEEAFLPHQWFLLLQPTGTPTESP